ncbi:MAG: hypothetical protein AB8G05_25360 [Oligoflexales bacterium]
MENIIAYYLLILTFCFYSCSYEQNSTDVSSSGESDATIEKYQKNEEEEEEEDIPAAIPIVISGAHLTCTPVTKDLEMYTLDVACQFERNGKVIENYNLNSVYITAENQDGKDLVTGISEVNKDGRFLLTVSIPEDSDLRIEVEQLNSNNSAQIEKVRTIINANDIRSMN